MSYPNDTMLDQRSARFATLKFSEFYRSAHVHVDRIEAKEFGFGDFDSTISKRHIGFRDVRTLNAYLAAAAPSSVSFSSAFYRDPEGRPMERKGWLGSELVFDLDASDLRLPCQARHGKAWVCSMCLDSVKREVFKLVEDFLVPDFAIPKAAIHVNFSGNRGYHLHVTDERFYPLKTREREQITGYITARGINMRAFFPSLGERGRRLTGPKPTDPGWGGKLAKGVVSALNSGEPALTALGIEAATARKLIRSRADVILGITTGNWDKINIGRKADFWTNVLNGMAVGQTSSIDRNVTSGIEHLIRLPGTIHPGTGLLAKPVLDLGRFDPMREAPLFMKGVVRVKVEKAPEFSMGGRIFGPFEKETAELPTYAALYLMLKRVAVLA